MRNAVDRRNGPFAAARRYRHAFDGEGGGQRALRQRPSRSSRAYLARSRRPAKLKALRGPGESYRTSSCACPPAQRAA
jgi:hypothetical protein